MRGWNSSKIWKSRNDFGQYKWKLCFPPDLGGSFELSPGKFVRNGRIWRGAVYCLFSPHHKNMHLEHPSKFIFSSDTTMKRCRWKNKQIHFINRKSLVINMNLSMWGGQNKWVNKQVFTVCSGDFNYYCCTILLYLLYDLFHKGQFFLCLLMNWSVVRSISSCLGTKRKE